MRGKLKIGILVDAPSGSPHVRDLVHWASAQSQLEFSHLVIVERAAQGSEHTSLATPRSTAKASLPRRFIEGIEAILLERYSGGLHAGHFRACDLSALVPERVVIRGDLSDGALAELRDQNLDLLLIFGSADLPDEIANASRLGTIRLRYGEGPATHDCPAGFWESFRRCDRTGFEIERVAGSARQVLASGRVATQFFYSLNQAFLMCKANELLKTLLVEIAREDRFPTPKRGSPYSGPLHIAPSAILWLAYGLSLAFRLLRWASFKLVGMQLRWGILIMARDWRDAALYQGTEIVAQPGRFLADPFLLCEAGKTYCFVEDYQAREGKGLISVYELNAGSNRDLGPCLIEPFHLSFPFVFHFEGGIYMIPETSAAQQIRLYRCKMFPLEWELDTVLLDDVFAADTMVFPHESRWWMLTNIDCSGLSDGNSELHVFWADSPRATQWTPHPANPLVFDSGYARNGGLVIEEGRLFRVAQAQGFDFYGHHTTVFEIAELTDTTYREEPVAEILPEFKDTVLGTHHMSAIPGFTVVDFVENVPFAARQAKWVLPRRWRRPDPGHESPRSAAFPTARSRPRVTPRTY